MDYYLATVDGKRAGPYSLEQLRAFWTSGSVTRATPYWRTGMADWRPIAEIENALKPSPNAGYPRGQQSPRTSTGYATADQWPLLPPLPQPTRVSPKPRSRVGRVLLAGCLVLLAVPIICVGLIVLFAAVDSPESKSSPAWQPPTEIAIDAGTPAPGGGIDANFVFCDEKGVQAFVTQFHSLKQALPPFESPEPSDLASDPAFSAARNFTDWMSDYKNKCLQDGTGILIPAGTYRITGFLDGLVDGHRLSQGELKPFQLVFEQIDVNGRPVYHGTLLPMSQEQNDDVRRIDEQFLSDNGLSKSTAQATILSKGQWRAAVPQNGTLLSYGQIICNKEALFQAVGQPTHEEAVGDDVNLFWDCSDGQVEVVAVRGPYEATGLVTGKMNEY
jgi:hypothetical protein